MTASTDLVRAGDQLVEHCRALAAAGLVTAAAGNASVRVGGQVLLTATGARFDRLTVDDLVLLDDDGTVRGTGRPSSELQLHVQTYRHRPDAGAIVHTHGRHAVAVSCVREVVPAVHYYCVDLGGPVPVAPYRTFGTAALAEVTTTALGGRNAVVMANHGSLTVGADMAQAAARAELVEWLCEVALLALSAGTPVELDEADLDAVRQQIEQGRPR